MKLLILAVLGLAIPLRADADPTSTNVTVEVADLQELWRGVADASEEPVGLKVDKAAPKFKLLAGDVIRMLNGRAATRMSAGSHSNLVYLDVQRGTQQLIVRVAVKVAPTQQATTSRSTFERYATAGDNKYLFQPITKGGKPSGVALLMPWYGVLSDGDIIRAVDNTPVTTLDQFTAALVKVKAKPDFTVKVDRFDQPVTIKVTFESDEIKVPGSADPATDEERDELQAAIDKGVKKIDDTHYEISKSLVDKMLANPMAVSKGARVVPAMKDGKPSGFKLYAIRPSSIYAKLGLSNGDTLKSINKFDMTSADKALEVYTKLREAKTIVIDIERRGKPITLTYTIR